MTRMTGNHGQWVHAGKGATFGLGAYRLESA